MNAKPLFWIIDDEWPEHELEIGLMKAAFPECDIRLSDNVSSGLEVFGKDADVIVAQISAVFTREVLQSLRCCKGIAVSGSGYNNVDVQCAKQLGIPVTNVNGYCAEDLADYVLAAMFHFYKRLPTFWSNIHSGAWGAAAVQAPIHRLSTQTLFLMGFGFIGKVTAQRAKALGMQVLVYDPYISEQTIQECGVQSVSLEQGLAQADFVSIHIRLTPETTGLVGMAYFKQMKPSAVLINVSRGALICEPELIEALNQGVIAGAVLDVVSTEPIELDNPLLSAPNILITPHVSYASAEAMVDLRRQTVENALAMYRGERPRDLVSV